MEKLQHLSDLVDVDVTEIHVGACCGLDLSLSPASSAVPDHLYFYHHVSLCQLFDKYSKPPGAR